MYSRAGMRHMNATIGKTIKSLTALVPISVHNFTITPIGLHDRNEAWLSLQVLRSDECEQAASQGGLVYLPPSSNNYCTVTPHVYLSMARRFHSMHTELK